MTSEEVAIWTAVIVAVPTVLTAVVVPIALRILDMRAARQKDERDTRRQDEVARRALEAVEASKRVSETNNALLRQNTAITQDTSAKLEEIKTQIAEKK